LEFNKMNFETIDLKTDGAIGVLTLNRPKSLNSMNKTMLSELLVAFDAVNNDSSLKVLILTGAGRGFCAGADLAWSGFDLSGSPTIGEQVYQDMLDYFNPVTQALYELNVPTIAAVNGTVAGGGVGIALSCDIVLAARSSKFIQVFIPQLGIIPDCGATWHLPRQVGRARTLGMSFFGDPLDAQTAEEWGLIWKCIDDDKLLDTATKYALRLSKSSTAAFVEARKVLDQAPGNSLAQQLTLEAEAQLKLCDEPSFIGGVMKFLKNS